MLWIDTSEGRIGLNWVHREDPTNPKSSHVTMCVVCNESTRPLGIGAAWCSRKESFIRARGRKISLTRALEDAGFSKELRQDVWNGYLGRRHE